MTIPEAVAWMVAQIAEHGELSQEEAADYLSDELTYENDAGNRAISPSVLKAFKKASDHVVWEQGNKLWRVREEGDETTRRQS